MVSDASKGYLCVAAAALMWASSGTTGRFLFQAGVTPSDLVQVRVTLASVVLGLGFLLADPSLFRIARSDVLRFAFLGGFIMAVVQISYFYTISKIQVMAAVLLQYMSPILVAVFSMLVWHEKVTLVKIGALAISFVGCYLVVGGYNMELFSMNRLGIASGAVAAVSYAAYALMGERLMQRYRPWTVVFYALAFSAVSWQLIHPPLKFIWAPYDAAEWGWIFYIIVVGTILPFGLYFLGINHLRSTRAMITATLEPISAGIMANLLLGETLDPPQLLGAALVVGSIVVLSAQREQDIMTPQHIRANRSREGREG